MILVAAGDSMVWGSELQDSPHGGPNGYSRKTFTALLAGEGYECVAYPGIGNKTIAFNTITTCEKYIYTDVPISVLVCWTWPSRDSAINSDNVIQELEEFLSLYQIPYLFTCVDNCIITPVIEQNLSNWFLFPAGIESWETTAPRGFYQWAVENKYTVGPEGHPLEDAHRDAVELIKERYYELDTQFN